MKIQLLTAVAVLALSSSAFAGNSNGPKPGGTSVTNNATNSLAIGGETLVGTANQQYLGLGYNSGGRAVAGSVYLEGNACDCDFSSISNKSMNAIAVGTATAGSVHVNTMGRKH